MDFLVIDLRPQFINMIKGCLPEMDIRIPFPFVFSVLPANKQYFIFYVQIFFNRNSLSLLSNRKGYCILLELYENSISGPFREEIFVLFEFLLQVNSPN